MINYIILVSNEVKELNNLLKNLIEININFNDIIVIRDINKTNQQILDILLQYNIKTYDNPLNMDFSQQRNFAKLKCWYPYLFYIDVDETIPLLLIQYIYKAIEQFPNINIFGIPRLNTFINDTNKPIPNDIGSINGETERIGWPDYQWRLIKNIDEVQWYGKVHEIPISSSRAIFPNIDEIAIQHIKLVSEQIKRKNFYEDIKKDIL